jgi:8-oxo-dGTP diphosphatase
MVDRPLVVAAAIVDHVARPRRLLAARRSAPKSLAGRWEFPGGKVEPDEDPIVALHREIAEELGVRVRVGTGPMAGDWPVLSGHLMRVWTAVLAGGEPRPLLDHDELRWLGPGEWDTVPWLEGDVPIVEALARSAVGPPTS